MRLYDFIYYCFYKAYFTTLKARNDATLFSIIAVVLIMLTNFFTICMLTGIELIKSSGSFSLTSKSIICIASFLIGGLYFYPNKRYRTIIDRFDSKYEKPLTFDYLLLFSFGSLGLSFLFLFLAAVLKNEIL